MRPINKGVHPIDAAGVIITINHYQHARPALIERLGDFCSYCEMQLDASLAVEHVKPKDTNHALALSWDNFLLSCTNCNSTKGNTPINITDYYWPDKDNTFIAFDYLRDGIVQASNRLNCAQKKIATNTIRLVGLDKTPDKNPSASDRRWLKRREVWEMAERARERLMTNSTDDMCCQIVDTARATGYRSIWMTVFNSVEDMPNRFIAAFPGTCTNCFNPDGTSVNRAGGRI